MAQRKIKKSKTKKSKNFRNLPIFVGVVLILGIGIFLHGNNSNSNKTLTSDPIITSSPMLPTNSITPKPRKTVPCNTYVNSQYNFQITCPDGYEVYIPKINGTSNKIPLDRFVIGTSKYVNGNVDESNPNIDIDIYSSANVNDLKQWIIDFSMMKSPDYITPYMTPFSTIQSPIETFMIGGEDGITYVGGFDYSNRQVLVKHGNYIYRFWLYGNDEGQTPASIDNYRQILSTFKFIN